MLVKFKFALATPLYLIKIRLIGAASVVLLSFGIVLRLASLGT